MSRGNQWIRVFQIVIACFAILMAGSSFTKVRAYQQSPWAQKDAEIARLKARIVELENQQASCLKLRRDPSLHEPVWASEGE